MSFETDHDFLNAKLHGMRSTLIEGDKLLKSLEKAEDEIVFGYGTILPSSDASINRLMLEKVLLERDILIFKKIHKFLSKEDKIVVELFYEDIFLDNLKVIFKLWHRKQKANVSEFLVHIPGKKPILIEKLLSAEVISEFARFIDDKTYTDLFLLASKYYKAGEDTFKFETYLDTLHFNYFYKQIKTRFTFEEEGFNAVLNTVFDVANLLSALRLREIYQCGWEEAKDLLYQHSGFFSASSLKDIYDLPTRAEFIKALPSNYGKLLIGKENEPLSDIETILNNYSYTIINKRFYTNLNCLVKILCFVFLKKFETRNLITISEGKRLNTDRQDILKSLIPSL